MATAKKSVKKASKPVKKASKPKKVKTLNRIALVVDHSGSMRVIRNETVAMFNNQVASIRDQKDQATEVSLFYFDDVVRDRLVNVGTSKLQPIDESDYRPDGNTALFDAVAHAVEKIGGKKNAANTSYVVLVLTDGMENASQKVDAARLRKLMQEKQSTDVWTFAFMVPGNYAKTFQDLSGLPYGNILPWSNIKNADVAASQGLKNFFDARRQGHKSTKNFFVQTDLSKVKKSDLKKLDDISDDVRIWNVDLESDIRDFVQDRNKGNYTKGHAFYMLTKPEEVQDYKRILVVEKGTKKVLEGARALLGMPAAGTAKVVPGNHANYDIYVQSTSFNRRLVRGTKLVYIKDSVQI